MHKSRSKVVVNKIIQILQMTIGICSFIFGVIGVIASTTSYPDRAATYFAIFFIIVGVLLMYFSNKRSKLAKTFKTYVNILSSDETGSIENLALELDTSEDIIKKNLNLLISKGFFLNAYIDLEENRVVFPSTIEALQNINQPEIERIAVSCKKCGGTSRIPKGRVGECDYCGSPIQ